MTEPDIEVPEADRAEQAESVDPSAPELAGEATPPGPDVPEADALEQQLTARPGESGSPLGSVGDREADEADVLEQEAEVPVDDDDLLT